jgi:uncharacterized membrane protein
MRDGDFRVRGKEISRVEGLSDAVFGFAITLLIVSLEVPKSADEVLHTMRGFFAFAITFALLFGVWKTQFTFFRRYGLEDNTTVLLTALLLFVILFFVFPLKFVIGAIVERLLSHAGFPDPSAVNLFKEPRAGLLMAIYAVGFAAVFAVFALLYRHAYSKKDELQLNVLEEFDTRAAMQTQMMTAAFGIVLAIVNFVAYLLPESPTTDRITAGLSTGMLVILLLFVRSRRRVRVERRALMSRIREEVQA